MPRIALLLAAVSACAALTTGCGATSFLGHNLIPTPQPSPIISVVPTSLTFTPTSKGPSTITASENNGNTFFSATTTDATIATVTAQTGSNNVFSVTATGKLGTCQIQVSDESGDTFNVQVTTN